MTSPLPKLCNIIIHVSPIVTSALSIYFYYVSLIPMYFYVASGFRGLISFYSSFANYYFWLHENRIKSLDNYLDISFDQHNLYLSRINIVYVHNTFISVEES